MLSHNLTHRHVSAGKILAILPHDPAPDDDQDRRLEEHLRAADEAMDVAKSAIRQIKVALGYPLGRGLKFRPKEGSDESGRVD